VTTKTGKKKSGSGDGKPRNNPEWGGRGNTWGGSKTKKLLSYKPGKEGKVKKKNGKSK